MPSAHDPKYGGSQGSPKFPPHVGLALLIDPWLDREMTGDGGSFCLSLSNDAERL